MTRECNREGIERGSRWLAFLMLAIVVLLGGHQRAVAQEKSLQDGTKVAPGKTGVSVVKIFVIRENGAGSGTGFVVSEDGYIATNAHVVNGYSTVGGQHRVFVLPDGRSEEVENVLNNPNAEVIWANPDVDLALLKVRPDKLTALGVFPVTLRTTKISQGRAVTAVGFPGIADKQGMPESRSLSAISTGTNSTVGRVIKDGRTAGGNKSVEIIQHGATVQHGNSGGPLFDECNRVVGINTFISLDEIRVAGKTVSVVPGKYYYAVSVRELIKELKVRGIPYLYNSEKCLSADEKAAQANQQASEINRFLKIALIVGGLGFVLVAGLVAYLVFRPREPLSSAPNSDAGSRNVTPSPAQHVPAYTSPRPAGTPNAATSNASQPRGANLILDGYGPNKERYRLVADLDDGARSSLSLGREPGRAGLVVNDESVSRVHCELMLRGRQVMIRDNNSTNGTFVDGRRLSANESVVLRDGGEVKMGAVRFRVIAR